jgi:leader peptidase (prepilin peptidase)/N-methyltransferase
MLYVFAFVGLFVGSFLNVLVLRLRDGEGFVAGRSRCPRCGKLIAWYDNIPLLSYFLLRGKCRHCGQRISWQYPLVEATTGVVFGITAHLFLGSGEFTDYVRIGWLLAIVTLLIAIAVYDALTLEIEMRIFIAVSVLIAGFLVWEQLFLPERVAWGVTGSVLAGAAASLFLGAIVWYSKERWMGRGDVWLVFPLAAIVGPGGLLPFLTLSFGIGAIAGILAVVFEKKTMKSPLPLGPFLVTGAFLQLSVGAALMDWFVGIVFSLSLF